jgi:hypothetical protein
MATCPRLPATCRSLATSADRLGMYSRPTFSACSPSDTLVACALGDLTAGDSSVGDLVPQYRAQNRSADDRRRIAVSGLVPDHASDDSARHHGNGFGKAPAIRPMNGNLMIDRRFPIDHPRPGRVVNRLGLVVPIGSRAVMMAMPVMMMVVVVVAMSMSMMMPIFIGVSHGNRGHTGYDGQSGCGNHAFHVRSPVLNSLLVKLSGDVPGRSADRPAG